MNDRFFKTYPEMKTQYFGFLTNLRQVHTFWCVEKGHAQSTAVPCLARMSCGWVPGCRATPRESCSASRRSSTGSTVRWVTPANHAVIRIAVFELQCSVRGLRREELIKNSRDLAFWVRLWGHYNFSVLILSFSINCLPSTVTNSNQLEQTVYWNWGKMVKSFVILSNI